MIKDRMYFISVQLLKFNNVQIKLNSNGIILTKKSHYYKWHFFSYGLQYRLHQFKEYF